MPAGREPGPPPDGAPRCIGKIRTKTHPRYGEQCNNPPIIGATVCRYHGGGAPQVRKAAAARAAKRKAEAQLARMGERIEGLDPTDVLLGLVWEAAGNVAFLRRKVQQLEQRWVGRIYSEVRIGKDGEPEPVDEEEPSEPGPGIVGPSHLGDGAAHVYLLLYSEWCDKLAKYSKMAIEAGLVERQVQLAEQQGALIAQVIRGVLADLEIAASTEVLAVVGRHLALAAGSPQPDLGVA